MTKNGRKINRVITNWHLRIIIPNLFFFNNSIKTSHCVGFWIILRVGTQYAWILLSVRNNRITELQILEKKPGRIRSGKRQAKSIKTRKKQAKYITGIKNRPNTLWKSAAHYGLKIKNQLTKIDFKERKIMKAIKKGYSLAELSMVVLIVSMVSYLVVPS